jgi:hypothetical protein
LERLKRPRLSVVQRTQIESVTKQRFSLQLARLAAAGTFVNRG